MDKLQCLKAAATPRKKKEFLYFRSCWAGATDYRTKTARDLSQAEPPAIIRGNASEIMALYDDKSKNKGSGQRGIFRRGN